MFFREPVDNYIILRIISPVNFTAVLLKKEKTAPLTHTVFLLLTYYTLNFQGG